MAAEDNTQMYAAKCENLTLSLNSSAEALNHCESELLKAKSEVKELQSSSIAKAMNSLVTENRLLREQAIKLRSV
jgi:hypothetical protein